MKGTDGREVLQKAMRLGAVAIAPTRAMEALGSLRSLKDEIEIVTYPCEMGENEARNAGFETGVVGKLDRAETSSADTRAAAKAMLNLEVDLLMFVGGDGTARDVCESVGQSIPVLGVPAGVKIHSAVFGVSPRRAGELAVKFLRGETELRDGEVMDVDEEAFRVNRVAAKLYGYLRVPYEEQLIQSSKNGSSAITGETTSQQIIGEYVRELMDRDWYYILGPGTTVKAVADAIGVKKTLLGVDVVYQGRLVDSDVNEDQLLRLIDGRKVKIIVSPIGRQGFVFGRGNQQISPRVIRAVGVENVIIIATRRKLASIGSGKPLLVDTGDEELDKALSGYRRVIVGRGEEIVMKVAS